MPPDPNWGSRIRVTGYWYHPEQDAAGWEMPEALSTFLNTGEKPIFVAFGKAESDSLALLQRRTVAALRAAGIRAIVQAFQIPEAERESTDRLFFVGPLPYSAIFPRVRAVVHHGGCTTCGLGLWAGQPTLVIPLALDQYYYGRTIYELGLGSAPLYIRKKLCSQEALEEALRDLVSGRYDAQAKNIQEKIRQEDGIVEAADLLEAALAGAQGR